MFTHDIPTVKAKSRSEYVYKWVDYATVAWLENVSGRTYPRPQTMIAINNPKVGQSTMDVGRKLHSRDEQKFDIVWINARNTRQKHKITIDIRLH